MDSNAIAEKPPFHSIEATADRYSARVALRKADGTSVAVSTLAADLQVNSDHPRYNDVNRAVQQVAAIAEVMGVMNQHYPTPKPEGNIMPEMPKDDFNEFARRLNNWPKDKKINIDYRAFASVLAEQLTEAGIDDVASKAKELSQPPSPNPA